MHGGQNRVMPFQSVYNGIDWGVDEPLQRLIDDGLVRKTVVVGIRSAPKRHLEYLRFIVEELKPYTDRNYRTHPAREDTFLVDSSVGGLFSFLLQPRSAGQIQ